MATADTAGGGKRAAVAFILVTVVLDVLALGLVIPVLPKLVERMAGSTERAAFVFGIFGTAWALAQFFFSPLFGALSDRFGRRPVLLASSLGLGVDYIFMALAPDLVWLFAGRVVSGITAATFSTATAYIADVTPPEERAARFGLIGAAFGIGFIAGPAIGGLLGTADARLPFWVAAGASLLNTAYGFLVLPESLPPERRRAFSWRRANPVGALKLLQSNPQLFGLSMSTFLFNLAHAVFPPIFVLHAGYRFGWDVGAVGLALAAFGITGGIVQGALVKQVVGRIGERRAMLLGMACGSVGLFLYAIAPRGWMFLLATPVIALWGFIGPATQGMMTRLVSPSEQGQLQGAGSSLMAVASLIGPTLYTTAFAFGIDSARGAPFPGAPYFVAACLLALAIPVAMRATRARLEPSR